MQIFKPKVTFGQQLMKGMAHGFVIGAALAVGGLVVDGVVELVSSGLERRKVIAATTAAYHEQAQQTRPVA